MMIALAEDKELIERLKSDDETAFRKVFDCYHRKIYQFAYGFLKDHDLSEEVVQDVFLNFWLYRGRLSSDAAIAPLLFTVARRNVINHWRKMASSNKFRQQLADALEETENSTEAFTMSRELEQISQSALQLLTEQQRQVYILSREEELTYDEIAERMQISRHTVKYHMTNALAIIRKHFTKHGILYLFWLLPI